MFYKLFAIVKKDWVLVWRDKVRLIMLFILPMSLVLFISLVHFNDPSNPHKIKLLLLNKDRGSVSTKLVRAIKKVKAFKITRTYRRSRSAIARAKKDVVSGEFRALVIIPGGLTRAVNRGRRTLPSLKIIMDPAIPSQIKENMNLAFKILLTKLQLKAVLKKANYLGSQYNISLRAPKIKIKELYAGVKKRQAKPNVTQRTVPAWALFGMFFIVVPLSGGMLRERQQKVILRSWMAPVSRFNLLFGRIVTYVLINCLQLLLMLLEGAYILPYFGMPSLQLTTHIWPLVVTGLCASLSAIGFGLLMGSFFRTYEQVTVLGPFLVVILSAIGGILTPAYLMPPAMRAISYLSPMNWAHGAFVDIFIRNYTVSQLQPDLLKLLAFFVGALLLSLLARQRSSEH